MLFNWKSFINFHACDIDLVHLSVHYFNKQKRIEDENRLKVFLSGIDTACFVLRILCLTHNWTDIGTEKIVFLAYCFFVSFFFFLLYFCP